MSGEEELRRKKVGGEARKVPGFVGIPLAGDVKQYT